MTTAQITADANRYDAVWGSFNPAPWRSANPSALVGRYYIPEEDNMLISGHDINWWLANHPDWILYACDSNGNPTKDYAYTPGDGFADVPLDMHNPAVVQYQQQQSLLPYAVANNYNALSIDEVIFRDIMEGGNPKLGQTVKTGEYGCGIYQGSTFVKRYTGPTDPQWTVDLLNWIKTLRTTLKTNPTYAPKNIALMVNHPVGSTTDPNENTLISNIDVVLDETGFSDYGNYQGQQYSRLFAATVQYMQWAQSHAVGIVIIDKFAADTYTVTPLQLEYSMATYAMGDQRGADLFVVGNNGPGYGYGAEQYYSQYATTLGSPCGPYYGGASYDPSNPAIYYRRYVRGMVVVNSGSLPQASETATLLNHTYKDIFGRAVTNPLTVNSNDAYVLTTTSNGCS